MRSDNVKKGMQQAPHRSLFNALGFTKEELEKAVLKYNERDRRYGGVKGE